MKAKVVSAALLAEFERHTAIIEAMPDLHSVSFTVYMHGEKTECVVEYRAQAAKKRIDFSQIKW